MAIDDETVPPPYRRRSPPAFNVPPIILVTIVVLALVQAVRSFVLSPSADEQVLLDFAFVPACYEQDCAALFARAAGADIWSPLSHSFLHGDWTHLGLNVVWLLAFGTPVARRIGATAFLAFSASGAAAGAGLFFLVNPDLMVPVVGASGIVSALMGGACRFAFASMGRRSFGQGEGPLLSLGQALSDRTVLFFILIFFATNILTASGLAGFIDGGASVAWEAHLGGFIFGFLAFGLFDGGARTRTQRGFE